MNRTIAWLFGILLLHAPLASTAAAAEEEVFQLRGVVPGVTTLQALAANERWGQPKSIKREAGGVERRSYDLRGYNGVEVLLHQDLVQTIDVTLPDKLPADTAATLLQLGDPQPDLALPAAAALGASVDKAWQAVPHSAGRVVLYVGPQTKTARRLRIYADRVLPLRNASDTPGAPPAPGQGPPEFVSQLTGTTAHQRQALMTSISLLERNQIAQHPLDEVIARRTIANVLETLDPYKLFLRHEDYVRCRRHELKLVDELKQGDASFIFDIARTRQTRTRETIEMVLELTDAEHDFTIEESLILDRGDSSYLENDLEAREVWRKRVKAELLSHLSAGATIEEARRRTARFMLNQREAWDNQDNQAVLNMLINALCNAYDPHSAYYGPQKVGDFLVNMEQQLVGIGLSGKQVGSYYTIQRVIPGGPAAKHGQLKQGDRILAVGATPESEMVDVVGMPLAKSVQLIRGEKGVPVRLRVLPLGEFETKLYTITRDTVDLTRLGSALLAEQDLPEGRQGRIGWIDMPMFYTDWAASQAGKKDYRSVERDMAKILAEFRKQQADIVVIDVRQNGGGSMRNAVNLCSMLVGPGLVTQYQSAKGEISPFTGEEQQAVWTGPLVLLTSKVSAGGTEVIAAALKDYHRALIIGDERTFGFGTSQSLIDLGKLVFKTPDAPKLGMLRVTTNRTYSPSGAGLQLAGVTPHVSIATSLTGSKYGEADLKYPLGHDMIAPGKYTPLNYEIPDKLQARLQSASHSRQAGVPHFQQLALERTAKPYNSRRTEILLHQEKYLAAQKARGADYPAVAGIPELRRTPWMEEALQVTLDYLAELEFQSGEKLYADRKYAEGVAAYNRALAADPHHQLARFKQAWSLATCPLASVRNGRSAVESAKILCAQDKDDNWNFVLTLAIAEAEAGDFTSAQKHLAEALEQAPAAQRAVYGYLEQRFKSNKAFQ